MSRIGAAISSYAIKSCHVSILKVQLNVKKCIFHKAQIVYQYGWIRYMDATLFVIYADA